MPTTSAGFDGFTDLSFSGVINRSPAIRNSYSRPNCARTAASADFIAVAFAGLVKSVVGSFRNSTADCFKAGMFPFRALDAGCADFAIVPQPADPVLARRPAEPVRLHFDAFERKQIEGRNPGRCQVRDGRDEIGKEA